MPDMRGPIVVQLAKLELSASKRPQAARRVLDASREYARARELAPRDIRLTEAEEGLRALLADVTMV